MREVQKHPRLSLKVLVAGMHLAPMSGMTVREVKKDFPISARVAMTPSDDTPLAMAASVGVGVSRMAQAFKKIRPDIVVVLGDRVEALAAALAAAYMNIPLAHVHGGDRSASIDESARHAITKFAHIHFPATRESALRILKMGEERRRVFTIGVPAFDDAVPTPALRRATLAKYHLQEPFILVVQHPVTTRAGKIVRDITETLSAAKMLALPIIIIRPNADAGGRAANAAINVFVGKNKNAQAFRHVPRNEYLALLGSAALLIGNSSSGCIEAPALGTPVVNVGERQRGRECSGPVSNAPYERRAIVRTARVLLTKERRRPRITRKNTGKRIARILAHITLNRRLLDKRMAY